MQALFAKIVYQKTKENLDKYFANIFYNSKHKSVEAGYEKHLSTVEQLFLLPEKRHVSKSKTQLCSQILLRLS